MLGGIFFVVITPLLFQFLLQGELSIDAAFSLLGMRINVSIAALVILLAELFVFRKLTIYSSVLGSAYIIPVFLAIYALTLFSFILLRLDYGRFVLGMSFVASIFWFYILYYFTVKQRRNHFSLVPVGRARTLLSNPDADWVLLCEPVTRTKDFTLGCDAVVADFNGKMDKKWQRFLAQCALEGMPVFDFGQVREALTGKVRIDHISENTLGTLVPNIFYMKLKVLADSLMALTTLFILAPVLLICALLIKLDSPGPVLFRQKRIGYRGKPFVCYKFRTMASAPVL